MSHATEAQLQGLQVRLAAFMDEVVYPAESVLPAERPPEAWGRQPVLDRLREEARRRGLYHLFSATRADELKLSTVQQVLLAEITGRSPFLAQDSLGSLNPDAEVINLLFRFGTEAQKARWLEPLQSGRIGSALGITEPAVASSDPTALATMARQEGDTFILNGCKSWSLGGLSPICQLLVVLARTESDEPARSAFSLLLVPRDSAGVEVGESASYFGYDNAARGGLPRMNFTDVRVPVENVLGPRGQGFATSQTSLGPARLFHCARLVGAAERALDLMCARLLQREVGGRPLADNALWMDKVADARMRIEQSRAVTLAAAEKVDAAGAANAGPFLSLAKAIVPAAVEWVVDTAIQAHGSDGMSHTLPLATLWALARTLRFSDGPDEVHRMVVARAEFKRMKTGRHPYRP